MILIWNQAKYIQFLKMGFVVDIFTIWDLMINQFIKKIMQFNQQAHLMYMYFVCTMLIRKPVTSFYTSNCLTSHSALKINVVEKTKTL